MSKSSRRRLLFSSFRNVAFVLFLSAALVGSVGCAGGSNPFCCNSKEKSQVDNLERAQSLDEREKNSTDSEEDSDESQENKEEQKEYIDANILRSDGSGDATAVAAAPKTFTQETPVTVSTDAVTQETPAPSADSTGLLEPPVLPGQIQAPQDAQPAPSAAATASENETSQTSAPSTQTPVEAAPNVDEKPSSENQNASEESPKQDAQEPAETQDAASETPVEAVRSSRRDGPQRAKSRQVAQRAANRPVAVPQTRAAATLDAPAPVVSFRTRTVVPAVSTPAASPSVVSFRTRVVVP